MPDVIYDINILYYNREFKDSNRKALSPVS